MHVEYKTIDEYIATFPQEVRLTLEKMRETIRKAAPNATETISYGMPTYKLNGNLVHFAAFKNHYGFYPTPSGIKSFETQLAPYIKGKGTIQFPISSPIPYKLIEQIVKFRIMENLKKRF